MLTNVIMRYVHVEHIHMQVLLNGKMAAFLRTTFQLTYMESNISPCSH